MSKEENKLKYEIILQNYEKMLRELNQNLEIPQKFNIKEAICIANIVKISFSFLSKSNYKRLIKLCEKCEIIAMELDKKDEEWYKEFEEIYNNIHSTYSTLQENLIEITSNPVDDFYQEITVNLSKAYPLFPYEQQQHPFISKMSFLVKTYSVPLLSLPI